MKRTILANSLALSALFLIPANAGAWRDGDKLNVCHKTDGTWVAVQIPKDTWKERQKIGDFPYEGPEKDHKPVSDDWCIGEAPKDEAVEPAVVIESGPSTAPAPTPQPVADNAPLPDFQGK